ncbi:MAG: hypothetical protein LUE98_07790 [Tannerellaceae bacterium]|nr:hypothetical protein [Tannerellaceae bacterium]
MGKGTDLLIDPDTGDLKVRNERNRQGVIPLGVEIGDVTYQNQAILLQMSKGELKETPGLGISIKDMVGDHEITGWRREIISQMEADGMTVSKVTIDLKKGELDIDASYD